MKKNNKFKDLLNKKGFYVALYSCSAVIVVIAGIISINNMRSINNNTKPDAVAKNQESQIEIEEKEDYTEYAQANQSDVKSYTENEQYNDENIVAQAPIKEENTQQNTNPTKETKKEEPTTSKEEPTTEKNNTTTEKSSRTNNTDKVFSMFDDSKEMSWPVSGKIVMDYSMDTAIYDKTLDQYRTNDSICIAAPVGTQVKAATEGIVETIFSDSENGQTVVLDHGNGWRSTYSQLQDNVLVKEGQLVKEGDLIGGVGNPSYYSILLGPHLEFKLTKDDSSTDPKLVLAEYDE